MLLRRDGRQPVVQAHVPGPTPAPVPEEPVASPLAEEAPVEQPAVEEARVEEAHEVAVAEPAGGGEVPPAPPPHACPGTDGVPPATREPRPLQVPTPPPAH